MESLVGSDLMITSAYSPNFLDEQALIKFMNEQSKSDGAIQEFSFTSMPLDDFFKRLQGRGNTYNTYISTACGYG